MKRVFVQFINDYHVQKVLDKPSDDCIEHCGLGISGYKERLRKVKNECNSLYLAPIDEKEVPEDCDVYFKPTALIQKDENVSKTFGFQTPSKGGSLLERIEGSVEKKKIISSPRTPRGSKIPLSPLARTPTTPKTPTSGRRTSRNVKSLYKTPTPSKRTCRRSLSGTKNDNDRKGSPATTPYSFRNKVKKRITRIVLEDNSDLSDLESEEDEYKPSDDSDDDNVTGDSGESGSDFDINDNETPSKAKSVKSSSRRTPCTPLRTPRRGREHKVNVDMTASIDDYFQNNGEKGSCVTSDRTLNQLETPRLGPEALQSLLEGTVIGHREERQEILDDHVTLFPHWMTVLNQGFSVFLCGVGSKKNLLSMFQSQFLADFDHLVINGFFPSLTIRTILSTVIIEVMGKRSHPQDMNEQMVMIESHYHRNSDSSPLFILVHNIDGPMLRNDKAQVILSQLAAFRHVHVIASVDHINAALLFDSSKYSSYNPLWWDATTLAPYREETSYENSLMVQQSGTLVLSSLIHVFKSLTPNAKGIFLILAKHQLKEKNNSNYQGLSFGYLYQKCREGFFVNSDLTLRSQLTEFKDHKLIRTKKCQDSVENLIIPLNSAILQEFLDQQEEDGN